ncbi:RING finger protein 223-like [Tiliqua scincoides]|uniref:RING finger protein 223-like n=1 Tax=Tiliqua scincoides TaxID=71010 RepID=UPI0034632EBD
MDSSPPPHTDQPLQEAAAALPIPECPVCYLSYDNAFNTPLLLPCAHTFCLECLAKLCAFLKESQSFQCPLCREAVPIPRGGVPKLPANMAIVQHFPPGMRERQEVWLDGFRLCWLKKPLGDSKDGTVVTVDLHRAPSRGADRRDPVGVWRPTRPALEMCHFLWEHYPSIFCAAGLLVLVVVLPLALILGLQKLY